MQSLTTARHHYPCCPDTPATLLRPTFSWKSLQTDHSKLKRLHPTVPPQISLQTEKQRRGKRGRGRRGRDDDEENEEEEEEERGRERGRLKTGRGYWTRP
ncbi:hypothetical protein E2C01_102848 [Portunus trituberculatus]|uniref:Uncharacterized protein n=1 Tax=Portunus trituberculatus TaxID=210409 RepID=A0A5B7KJI5_PORTR|nr:hypothetical protein [Portunus trituberculatus]